MSALGNAGPPVRPGSNPPGLGLVLAVFLITGGGLPPANCVSEDVTTRVLPMLPSIPFATKQWRWMKGYSTAHGASRMGRHVGAGQHGDMSQALPAVPVGAGESSAARVSRSGPPG